MILAPRKRLWRRSSAGTSSPPGKLASSAALALLWSTSLPRSCGGYRVPVCLCACVRFVPGASVGVDCVLPVFLREQTANRQLHEPTHHQTASNLQQLTAVLVLVLLLLCCRSGMSSLVCCNIIVPIAASPRWPCGLFSGGPRPEACCAARDGIITQRRFCGCAPRWRPTAAEVVVSRLEHSTEQSCGAFVTAVGGLGA